MLYRSNILKKLSWSVAIDLEKDFNELSKKWINMMGIKSFSDDKDYIYQYFNLQKRLVSPTPRYIEKSREFVCPKEYELALKEIKSKIQKGDNITPYMSDSILNINFNDYLLNDWNIHHFHLTRRFREDGFAKRSDYELFIYFTNDTAYFIQVYPHKKINLYSNKDMIRIIYDNWPQLIESNHLKGVRSMTELLDNQAYSDLRKANISTMVQIKEDLVFAPFGGGYMCDGSSMDAVLRRNFWIKTIRTQEHNLVKNIEYILNLIKIKKESVNKNLEFMLLEFKIDKKFTVLTVLEKNNEIILELNFQKDEFIIYKFDEFFNLKFLMKR
ncbi:hypothetical protein N2W46_000129 [Clostridium perfringens]|uniref:hypothetical protein n=1 Tax=Clostridium perfringens TaxID=1502 RepID=UPI002A20E758|nr:hypothetical protein [Clostridium perfringens]MDM1004211.1 hypothetical protein [Clostridium perfringens]